MLKAIEKYKSRYMTPENYPWVADMVRDVEDEIAERYMPLPCDADGVPIHVGDKMRFCDFNVQCAAVSPERIYYWDEYSNGHWVKGRDCRHVKPRTIEDVLRDFLQETNHYFPSECDEEIAKYAEEIREVLGVSK